MVQKRACDACHKRKIQCDSTSPKTPCNWCEHHGLDCTFNRVRGRKRPPKPRAKQTSEHSLAERLRRIEDTLSQTISRQNEAESSTSKSLTPSSVATGRRRNSHISLREPVKDPLTGSNRPSSSFLRSSDTSFDSPVLSHESPFISQIPSPAGGFTTTVSYGQIHYGGCHFGQLSQHNGMLLLSEEGKQWITSKTDEEVLFEPGSQHFSNPAPSSAAHYYNNPEGLYALPDRDIVETLFDMFVNSSFTLVFPIVDRILFKDTIELAYQPHTGETTSLEQLSAKNMHEIFSGRLRSAAMFHAIACRMIYTLGGHTNMSVKSRKSPINRSERERRQLRMLFWLCYIFDKDISLRTGQPPLMSDDYCDLTLPDGYLDCYNYLPNLSESLSPIASGNQGLTPHLPGDPRLSHIKERTNRLLYSAQAAKKTHAQLLQNIRELDEELEDWRVSIPPDFRPALSISDGSQVAVTGMHLPRSMRHITLHLEYHHLMTTIHRASGRCMEPESENSPDRGEWAAGVDSSMALALEASRSTLIYLKAAMCGLAGEAFWIIVFYPTAAMITLFFNLLMHPLDERAEQDLELLKSAADLVNSLPVQRLTPHEVSYMKDVNDFVLELVRLGRAAIAKATKEQDERLYIQMMSIH